MECSLLSNCLLKINQSWTCMSKNSCGRQRTSRSWRAITAACVINSCRVAIGVSRNRVEHAFCATFYASCLFFPVHLSWIAFTTSSHFYAGTRLDRGAEEHTYETLGHGVCNRGKKGYSGVTKEPCYMCAEGAGGKNWPKILILR